MIGYHRSKVDAVSIFRVDFWKFGALPQQCMASQLGRYRLES